MHIWYNMICRKKKREIDKYEEEIGKKKEEKKLCQFIRSK